MAALSRSNPFEVEGPLGNGSLDGRDAARDQTDHRGDIDGHRDEARPVAAIADRQDLMTRVVVPRARDLLDRLRGLADELFGQDVLAHKPQGAGSRHREPPRQREPRTAGDRR